MVASVRTTVTDSSSITTSQSVASTGFVDGELAIAWLSKDANDTTTSMTNFTYQSAWSGSPSSCEHRGFSRDVTGSEPANYSISWIGDEAATFCVVAIQDHNGVDTVATTYPTSAETEYTVSLTTAEDDTLLLALCGDENVSTWTPPDGTWTEHEDFAIGSAGSGAGMAVYSKVQATAGATGNLTFTKTVNDQGGVTLIAISSAASGRSTSLAVTEDDDTLSSAIDVEVSSSLAVTETDDSLSSTVSTLFTDTSVAVTETDDSLSASATVADPAIDSTVAVTEDDDTTAATVTLTSGTSVAVTETDDTLAANTAVAIDTAVAVTEEEDSLAASVTTGSAVDSSVAVTESDDSVSAVSSVELSASVAVSEDDDTVFSASEETDDTPVVTPPTGGWGDGGKSRAINKWAVGNKLFNSYEEAIEYYDKQEVKRSKKRKIPTVRSLGKVTYSGQPVADYSIKKKSGLKVFRDGSQYELEALKRAIEANLAAQLIEEEELFIMAAIAM